jgi:hypothetical protein
MEYQSTMLDELLLATMVIGLVIGLWINDKDWWKKF